MPPKEVVGAATVPSAQQEVKKSAGPVDSSLSPVVAVSEDEEGDETMEEEESLEEEEEEDNEEDDDLEEDDLEAVEQQYKPKVRRHEEEGEGDEDEDDESEDILSEEEKEESPFAYHPSEEDFQESDLQARKKRRFLMGGHSFLELTDPQLEHALDPAKLDGDGDLSEESKKRKGLSAERQKYKDLCKNGGFTPNGTFLAALGHSVLDLTNNGLSDKEIEAICLALCDDKYIEICRLSGNCCGKAGGLAIAEMIKNNVTIEELALSNTEIIEALEQICEAVSLTTNLISLDLSKNELINQDMTPVANMLAENQSLKILNLASNNIKDPGLAELGAVGIWENTTLRVLDMSGNRIKGEQRANAFFKNCGKHPQIRELYFHHNLIGDEGAAGFSRVLFRNDRIQKLDLSFNMLGEGAGAVLAGGLATRKARELEVLQLEKQFWHQEGAGAVLRPLGNRRNVMPIELVDFGPMLDIHKSFIGVRDKALAVHPELKIIHGEPYGMNKAKGPDEKPLVIRRANIVCENFATPLVMLMEELAKEPPILTRVQFKKFIKQCNLYKDKSLTEAFENVFASGNNVDGDAILAAFDAEYPGKRKLPEPKEEGEPKEKSKKKKKKKKGKGKKKGKKGKSKGKSKTGVQGAKKGKSKSAKEAKSTASTAKSTGGKSKAPKKGKSKT